MSDFIKELEDKGHYVVKEIYKVTESWPKSEIYGMTSQIRRAALSIVLNLVEGYARKKDKVYLNFLEISFGSAKETEYILRISNEIGYLSDEKFSILDVRIKEICKMLNHIIQLKRGDIKER